LATYPQAYKEYLMHFHASRDYFECHELLEEHWKSTEDRNMGWVGLIQIAVGFYHYRRANINGARKMLTRAISNINETVETGLDFKQLGRDLKQWLEQIDSNVAYFEPMLPLIDKELINDVKQLSIKNGYHWGSHSDLSNMELVNRHTRRDRSDVIQARQQSLVLKRSITIDSKLD
jgi:predicted metal-dependent hydrolase